MKILVVRTRGGV